MLRLSTELAAPPPWRCKLAAFTPEQQAEAIAGVKEHLAKAAEGLVSYEAQASWQEGLQASLEAKHKQNSRDRHRCRKVAMSKLARVRQRLELAEQACVGPSAVTGAARAAARRCRDMCRRLVLEAEKRVAAIRGVARSPTTCSGGR